MLLDAGQVLKRPVLCRHCHEEHLFTLRDLTENPHLKCYGCGNTIGIGDGIYDPLIREIRNTLAAIDYIPVGPLFYQSTSLKDNARAPCSIALRTSRLIWRAQRQKPSRSSTL
jgi:hypothetical protein